MAGKRKGTYKITNWGNYNESLVKRGSITFWFDEDVVAAWGHLNDVPKVGRPFTYSDTAISCMLTLRELFRLPYRQTEGLARSLAELMEADIPIPDYTSVAKRAEKLKVELALSSKKGPIDIVVDSTGLKVFGEGEWKMRQHGKSKRRTWRKLHLAVNPETHEIEAEVLTENSSHDADEVKPLLSAISRKIRTFFGDGAYDQWKVYGDLVLRKIQSKIAPRRNAKIRRHGNSAETPLARDEAIRGIRRLGRARWKEAVGYHLRSLSETAMYRIKAIFGDRLKNRKLVTQQTESRLRCKILNIFTQLGMPQFVWS